jgi:hypothetical protein
MLHRDMSSLLKTEALDVFKGVLTDVLAETAKRILFP